MKKLNINAKRLGLTLVAVVVAVSAMPSNAAFRNTVTTKSWFTNTFNSNPTPVTAPVVKDDQPCQQVAVISRATASSFKSVTETPDKAIDTLTNTAWKAQSGVPQWIEVELAGKYDVTGVRLNVNQTPDATTSPKPTPAYHTFLTGEFANPTTVSRTYYQDLYNGKWKMVDFTNTAYNTQFIRIKTSSTPAVQVAWNEVQVCGQASQSSDSAASSWLRAPDGSGYVVVNFCQGRTAILNAYASVPATIKVTKGQYAGNQQALGAGQSWGYLVDAKLFTQTSPWTGAADGNGTGAEFSLVADQTGQTLSSVFVNRNDAGCWGQVKTQDGSTYGIVDKCGASNHTLSIYSQVPAVLKVSRGGYSEYVNLYVPYDTNMTYVVDASKFTDPAPWDRYNGYNGSSTGNGTSVTFSLYRIDLGTEIASATISRNDTCQYNTQDFFSYPYYGFK